MTHPFLLRVESGPPILADGAMGTQLYERLGYRYVCFEELNVTNPQIVQAVHRAYLSAGAELIETNTFACNRFLLGMRGLEQDVERFARAGARIAREAQESVAAEAFVAGSVGPLNRTLGVPPEDMRSAFREVIEGLLLGGVDLFVLETFGSLEELLLALEVCQACSSLPIVASMTFAEDGRTLAGEEPVAVARALRSAGAQVIGANCGFGPQPTLEVVEQMRFEDGPPLVAMPNAGLPARHEGRLVYTSGPDYFAEYAERLTNAGVRMIGGCCGTSPSHIKSMRERLDQPVSDDRGSAAITTAVDFVFSVAEPTLPERRSGQTRLREALQAEEFVISVEMRPPRGANPSKVLRAAEMLRGAGVTVLDVTDSALGRVRMNAFSTAYLIQSQTGLDVIAHLTTRDRNLMALQADLIGAHALGIRHVLALTGDPPNSNSWAPTTGVYDVDAIGLITLIKKLNEGQDAAGTSIGTGTDFLIGCSLNPTAENLDVEMDRLHRKLEAGADFVMTQAVYDPELFRSVLDSIGSIDVPVLLELLPLQNFKNAEFIHNELPGVSLPPSVLERMRRAGNHGPEEGMDIAREVFLDLFALVQGVYIIPVFDRYEQAAELTRQFRAIVEAERALIGG